jgi:hypothetical protein
MDSFFDHAVAAMQMLGVAVLICGLALSMLRRSHAEDETRGFLRY